MKDRLSDKLKSGDLTLARFDGDNYVIDRYATEDEAELLRLLEMAEKMEENDDGI